MTDIKDKLKNMSKDEKIAEFRSYVTSFGLKADVNRIVADQAVVGAPDSAWDDALLRCATAAGSLLGVLTPLTAHELAEALCQRQRDAPALPILKRNSVRIADHDA